MKYVNWPLKLAFSGRGQRKGNSQKVISSKYIVESECFFFFFNAEALFSFWQLFVFIVFVCNDIGQKCSCFFPAVFVYICICLLKY